MTKPIFSFVVDQDPKFFRQARVLLASLQSCGVCDEARVLMCSVGPAGPELRELARETGVEIREIAPFGSCTESRYCNKIQQLSVLMEEEAPAYLLSDCDTYYLETPFQDFLPGHVRAKPVDGPNPDEATLRAVLEAAGFPDEAFTQAVPHALPHRQEKTHWQNCNGGLYLFDRACLEALHETWADWARFCLARKADLGRYQMHCDQIAFLLALLETGLPFKPLPVEANCPTHMRPDFLERLVQTPPRMLHYHSKQADSGFLEFTGVYTLDQAISKANFRLARGWPEACEGR